MKLLSDEWLAFVREQAATLPVHQGASLVMQHVVSGSPAGKVQCRAELCDGRLVELEVGKRADATCTVTWTYEDALAALRGDNLDVAFMRGRLKLDGDYRAFMYDLRPVFSSPEGQALVAAVRSATDD
jgi:hypothetical protein